MASIVDMLTGGNEYTQEREEAEKPKAHENIDNLITLSTLNNINPDYTGASAQKYIDKYTNRPEDAGELSAVQGMLGDMGMTPVAGEPADFLNALLYGMQGDTSNMVKSFGMMIPYLGNLIKGENVYKEGISALPSEPVTRGI